jgi:hypothetical protein
MSSCRSSKRVKHALQCGLAVKPKSLDIDRLAGCYFGCDVSVS